MTSEFNIQDWPTLETQVNITLRKNRRTSRILVFSCNSSSPYLAFEGEVDGAVVLCAPEVPTLRVPGRLMLRCSVTRSCSPSEACEQKICNQENPEKRTIRTNIYFNAAEFESIYNS